MKISILFWTFAAIMVNIDYKKIHHDVIEFICFLGLRFFWKQLKEHRTIYDLRFCYFKTLKTLILKANISKFSPWGLCPLHPSPCSQVRSVLTILPTIWPPLPFFKKLDLPLGPSELYSHVQVHLNCTSDKSHPAANLTWMINNQAVNYNS